MLKSKGEALWPVVSGLAQWGDTNDVPEDRRSNYWHRTDNGTLTAQDACSVCGVIPAADVVFQKVVPADSTDQFAIAMREPHRLLETLRV